MSPILILPSHQLSKNNDLSRPDLDKPLINPKAVQQENVPIIVLFKGDETRKDATIINKSQDNKTRVIFKDPLSKAKQTNLGIVGETSSSLPKAKI